MTPGVPSSPAAGGDTRLRRGARRSLLAAVFILAAPALGSGRTPAAETDVVAAITRGLAWIERHPATVQDGGLIDIVDEGVAFLLLHNLSRGPGDRSRFAAALRARLTTLEQLPALEARVSARQKTLIDHYHLVLTAHLMQLAGQPSGFQPIIVEQAQRALLATPHASPTVRLTIAAFLDYLREAPAARVDSLLPGSLVAQVARAGLPELPAQATEDARYVATLLLSALVHEIIALTDFGRRPPSRWLAERRAALRPSLVDGVRWARAERNLDLACELVMTARFLGAPLHAELHGLKDELIASQQPDGDWGASPTTPRQNKVRHTVLTATATLWAYANPPKE